jgi:uncharacterized protein YukE
MPDIRVDPPALRQTAAKFRQAADRVLALAEEGEETAASAPSYDGQFGPQVQSMGLEAHAQMTGVATKLTALSDALLIKAEEFEAADRETEGGLAGLFAKVRAWIASLGQPQGSPWLFLSPAFEWLFQDVDPPDEGEPPQPWYGPLAIELGKAWNWYHQNVNVPIYESLETWRGIGENGNKIALYYLGQIWFAYDKVVNQPIYEGVDTWRGNLDNARTIVLYGLARLWFGYDKAVNQPIYGLYAVQGPGADSDGPITGYLDKFSSVDASGNVISPVGAELTGLIQGRQDGVTITFIDFNAGIVPWQGHVVLPPNFADGGQLGSAGNVGLVGHELTHVLERDLNDPMYWPSGAPALGGARLVGDSTNYMEVLSNIVGQTVEHDYLSQIPPASRVQSQTDRLLKIEDNLATYTDADALNATRYLVKSDNSIEVYRDNYVHELGISDHRIPAGGWDHWLKTMGFTDTAIQHISDIASQGTAVRVDPAELSSQNGLLVTPTPTPTASPTATPTGTATPTPPSPATPTATQPATPTSSSTPSASATSTPPSSSSSP